MSFASPYMQGGMINPMKPDGTMMTQKEIKAVQARNRRMNKRMTGGLVGIGGAKSGGFNPLNPLSYLGLF
jgi:hypothetical protein